MGKRGERNAYKILVENLEEIGHLGEQDIERNITLKSMLKESSMMFRTRLVCHRINTVMNIRVL